MNDKPIGKFKPILIITSKPLNNLTFNYLEPNPSNNKKNDILIAAYNITELSQIHKFTKALQSATAKTTIKFLMDIIFH